MMMRTLTSSQASEDAVLHLGDNLQNEVHDSGG